VSEAATGDVSEAVTAATMAAQSLGTEEAAQRLDGLAALLTAHQALVAKQVCTVPLTWQIACITDKTSLS
jgi:hypothetical protein